MKDIGDTLRAARAARLTARRERALSKSLRAWLRAQWLVGRATKRKARELRARVQAEQLIMSLRSAARREVGGSATGSSPAARYESGRAAARMRKA